ncbi:DNA-directed DNA polymerase delta subunit [Saccharomycopsis crataegensis]|uniref:DNA-directed DNA polymerase delta subunit n=1 Tax=Saccharomycopsis crataegensis TaxID=43959 RepID=A0AAV5QNM1_9ASCO|nr:DNA-directed DNA polymerase delta subunit [Saccharomycopsis crataegensis]
MSMSQSTMFARTESIVPAQYPKDSAFHLSYKNRNYHNQYFHIYSKRLNDLRPRVLEHANSKWDNKKINGVQVFHCDKVLDIKNNEPCWVIGLTYCEMQYKPNILDDVAIGAYGVPPPPKPSYSDPDTDIIMLEDESGRVQLDGDSIKNSIFVTGNVIGVLGIELEAGQFKVLDVLYPGISEQVERPLAIPNNKIAIVSGMEIDPQNYNPVRLEFLKEFLMGEIGTDDQLSSSISRLVIAGNSTKTINFTHENDDSKFYGTKIKSKYNSKAMALLDSWIFEVLGSIPVDIIPGESDPTEAIFPQQPIHSAFFKQCKAYLNSEDSTTFRTMTNPSWLEIDGTRMLGTGGQNINDMFKYLMPYDVSSKESTPEESVIDKDKISQQKVDSEKLRADIIEATINWQNIIPSCPDTLWTYPFKDDDPFTLTEVPHVYFVGNQPQFQSRWLKFTTVSGKEIFVRLISIPKFNETGEIVLLDMNSLEPNVVKIC